MRTRATVLRVTGVSHRIISDATLTRVIPGAAEAGVLATALADAGVPHVLLVTCNRLECYWLDDDTAPDDVLLRWVQARAGAVDTPPLYRMEGAAALRHLIRVAAGLESMLAGDTDVLGQVRRAWLSARAAQVTDQQLDRMFERVIHAARRVQRAMPPNAAAQSIGAAAVQTVRARMRSRWDDAVVAVVGSGAAASSALAAMVLNRPRSLHLTARTPERMARLAGKMGVGTVAWHERNELIRSADVTVFAVRADVPLLADADAAQLLLHRTDEAPALWVDLGMPPNVAITTPMSPLQLLALPALMRTIPVSDDAAVHEVVLRELRYLHAALHARRPHGPHRLPDWHALTA